MNQPHDSFSTRPCHRATVNPRVVRGCAALRQALLWLCTLATLAPMLAWSQLPADDPPLLAAEDAFTFSAVPRGQLVRVKVEVQDGYYLYRDRIRVESRTAGVEIADILLPAGKEKDDPLFGAVQVYRGQAVIDVALKAASPVVGPVEVAVISQGCADLGVCYPPDTRLLKVAFGSAGAAATGSLVGGMPGLNDSQVASPISVLDRLGQAFGESSGAVAGAQSGDPFLPVDQAFAMRAPRGEVDAVSIGFDIADGYYLYRSRMAFELVSPEGVHLGAPELPAGKLKHDAYFGAQQVYYNRVQMRVPVQGLAVNSTLQLKVRFQGCADAGLCYPPQERVLPILFGATSTPDETTSTLADGELSETDQLARSISNDALVLVLGMFFLAGLLLAFTPCVLPMIPILSAIIAGQKDVPSAKSGLALSIVYVLAMSLTYTAAGVIAALFGQNLQALFQHPAVLIGFSGVFVVLALSMFGFYELQLPVALQNRLAAFSQRQRGGSYLGVGTMGVLSALIVGPCVAAPLAATLIVIGTAGDPLRGGLALFALSLGMGVPLLVVGAFGPRLLPRAGPWMVMVKQLFGVMLLAVAIYLLSRVIADALELALWSALALLSAVLVFRAGGGLSTSRLSRLHPAVLARVIVSVVIAAYGGALAVGAVTGAHNPLRPLAGVVGEQHRSLPFERVKSVADLDRVLAQAREDGRMVMLDFYADWCVSCVEMERDTFIQPAVHAALRDVVLIQADVTVYDDADKSLMERFGLHGPPAILFFAQDGQEQRALRVIGFMGAEEFQVHVARAARSGA
jgi:thiol:disulfide interchange protein DsbD